MLVLKKKTLLGAGVLRWTALLALWGCGFPATADELPQPVIKSVFPSAAQKGSTVTVEFRGTDLGGVYALWADSPGVLGEVRPAEPVDEQSPQPSRPAGSDAQPTQVVAPVVVQVRVDAASRPGTHWIRLVSPLGLSNAVAFFVADQPVDVEAGQSHHTPKEAQATQVPALIHGRLDKSGQLDCYSFMASEGDELQFEVLQTQDLKPRLALLGPTSSWFNAERLERCLFREERQSDLVPTEAKGTYRVPRSGRYVIQVSSLFGQGSLDASYLLAVSKGDKGTQRIPPPSTEWKERSFTRPLENGWLSLVQARSFKMREQGAVSRADEPAIADAATAAVPGRAGPATLDSAHVAVARYSEVGDGSQEKGVALPFILEGAIGKPADIDRYRFTVRAGDEIAVEIETPGTELPAFNPWVSILDSESREVFSNLHRKVSLFNNNAERQIFIAAVMPKMVHRFEKPGEYTLQVRDITSNYGDPKYRYRILVRQQVPHVGEISLGGVDRLNLERGRAGRVTLTTTHEEGFSGGVTFVFSGLPAGVQVFPADLPVDRKAPTQITENSQTVLAPTSETTLVLEVSPDALLTRMPQVVGVECRALEQRRLGPALLVRELPVMVVAERASKP